jgi:hypothetical protein
MQNDVDLTMEQSGSLLLDRGNHTWVTVSGVGHPDSGGEVEVLAARCVDKRSAESVVDDQAR